MQERNRFFVNVILISLFLLLAGVGMIAYCQDQKPMMIQATARGSSTQLGKMVTVNIHIDKYSTTDDRNTLISAFKRSGQSGLVDALNHMKGKGRFSTPYGVGNEVKYIIELPPDKGRRHIRLISDRRIAFGEAYANTRSEEYNVGAIDLFLSGDGKNSEGTVLPACKLKLDKKKQQIEIETYQNPWKLTNIQIRK